MNQLKIAVADDFCTVNWAADLLCVSRRQVMRYVHEGLLQGHLPRRAKAEQRHLLLSTAQVRDFHAGRKLVTGRG
jgi:hypothetical protein